MNSNTQIPTLQVSKSIAQLSKERKDKNGNSKICNRWTHQENLLYIRFLKQNNERLNKKTNKKFCKFQKMAFYIQSKNADQCRSHHQKMMIRFKSIDNIIDGLLTKKPIQQIQAKNQQVTPTELFKIESEQPTIVEYFENEDEMRPNQFQSPFYEVHSIEQDLFNVLF